MSGKKWREFWVSKGTHYGSKLRAFNILMLAQSYYTKIGRQFDAIQVIEHALLEEKEAQIKELVGALEVIASNGKGTGMGWTPAQHARLAIAKYKGAGQ